MKSVKIVELDYEFECPHCDTLIIVNQNDLNCHIFRHAVYKHNMEPINPHASKSECDYLLDHDLIYGCSKPFKLEKNEDTNQYQAVICDYI